MKEYKIGFLFAFLVKYSMGPHVQYSGKCAHADIDNDIGNDDKKRMPEKYLDLLYDIHFCSL